MTGDAIQTAITIKQASWHFKIKMFVCQLFPQKTTLFQQGGKHWHR